MKAMNPPEDERLRVLLRGARPAPALLPRFEETVWRRIETDEQRSIAGAPTWLAALAGWMLKPKFALALAVIVVLAGFGLGWNDATQHARQNAQSRYLAAVAPNSLR